MESRAKAVLIERFTFTNICFFCVSNSVEVLRKRLRHLLPVNLYVFVQESVYHMPHDALSTSSCLQEFEPMPKPISGTGLVPIGILVSSPTNTHRTKVTQGACLRAQPPSKSSVKHASHEAKAYRAGQSRRHTFRGA